MASEDIVSKLYEFLYERYNSELQRAANNEAALVIDFNDFDRYDPITADMLLEAPQEVLDGFSEAAKRIVPEADVNIRIREIPERRNIRIRNLRSKHMDKLWCIDTVIKSATEVKPQIYEVVFQCPECDTKMTVKQDSNLVQKPSLCGAPYTEGGCGRRGDFNTVAKKMYDVRWLTGVEPFEVTEGDQPGEIAIFLKEDLTTPKMQKRTDPGNRLKIVGMLKEVPKRIKGKLSTKMDMMIEALHAEFSEMEFDDVEITGEDERMIKEMAADPKVYEKLVGSVAPGIYGFAEIKEAIALQLFGGVVHKLPDGAHIRGNIHILLTGDPGVGKSIMLKFVSDIMPRGRYVSGSGATGAGLCTTGDSVVAMADGSFRKIAEMVEEKTLKPQEDGIFTAEGEDACVMTLDQKTFKLKPMKISKYWKLPSPTELIKITTRSGRNIRVTEGNPIPVLEKGKLIWKAASALKEGEYLAVPRALPQSIGSTSLIGHIDRSARLVNSGFMPEVVEGIRSKGIGLAAFSREHDISSHLLYRNWIKNPTPISIRNLEKITGGNGLESILPKELLLTQYRGHEIKLSVSMTEDFMYLIGLMTGDGNVCKSKYGGLTLRFSSNDEELRERFSDICSVQFGISPRFYKHPERIPYISFGSKIIAGIAEKFGLISGNKSGILEVTENLSALPSNLLTAYLRDIFDTDGYVTKRNTRGSDNAGFTTTSRKFATGIQMLLLKFGVLASVRERTPSVSEIRGIKVISGKKYELEIRGLENLKRFRDAVGFAFSKKMQKLVAITSKHESNTNLDIIPSIGSVLKEARSLLGLSSRELYGYKAYAFENGKRNISRNHLTKITERMVSHGTNEHLEMLRILEKSDIYWDEVKSVETVEGEDYVYDLTVEGEHSFVANGMIIHNTASVRKDEIMGGWLLEAGALILTNKSVICIDEFDKMGKDDQIAMHEAMSVESYHGDTEITLATGENVKIRDLVERMLEENKSKISKGDDCFFAEVNGPEILTTDFVGINKARAFRVSKHAAPDNFYRIMLQNGREVTVTPRHPFFVFDGKSFMTKPPEELKTGEFVPIPKRLPIEGEEQRITVESYRKAVQSPSKAYAAALKKLPKSDISLCAIEKIEKINNETEEWSYDISVPGEVFVSHGMVLHNTISIAKASIVATLPAQTAVLAGANPKLGRFDPYLPIVEQIQIPETLLSRFDLKFALRDIPDRNLDARLAEHITISRITPEVVEPVIDAHTLRKYIAYAKQKIPMVELTKDAAEALKKFYVEMRNPGDNENATVSITLRQYEALLRLAEASAKVRLDNKIRPEDVERSIKLMKYSLSQLGYDYDTGKFDIDKMESGVTASKRRKISIITEIISSMEKRGGEISMEDVKASAEEQGVENADEIIDRLKRDGMLFEPRPGFIKKA